MRLLLPILLVVLAAAMPADACNIRLTVPSVTVGTAGSYDPFASNPLVPSWQIQVTGDGSACPFFVTFSGTGGDGRTLSGPGTLVYNLYRDSQALRPILDLPDASSGDVLSGKFNNGHPNQTLTFYSTAASGQMVPPGTYSGQVTANLYEGSIGNSTLVDSRPMSVSSVVRSVAQINFAQNGTSRALEGLRQTLNFGALETGETRAFEIQVAGNAGYTIQLASENRGAMVNSAASGSNSIAYVLTLNGGAVALQSGASITFSNSTTTSPNRHQFVVTIGTVDRVVAGTYNDNLTLTVTSR